ncbi:hypothetical protein HPB49_003615 [Dermacentor silvarum]|uniref:Uncharacterized protein n=1 Tax=Dermacentor silvarum TaxID=543639 RepID=A0ACB8CPJ7_DERSI|nr:hypothetical protein HPB49_003615 [Dermacentor silvarum]
MAVTINDMSALSALMQTELTPFGQLTNPSPIEESFTFFTRFCANLVRTPNRGLSNSVVPVLRAAPAVASVSPDSVRRGPIGKPEQCTPISGAFFWICDTAASLSLTVGASPAAGANTTGRSGVMDEEAAMELLQDQLEEKNLTPMHVVRPHVSPQTIIMRLGTKLNLAKYTTHQVTNAIDVAAGLTASEPKHSTHAAQSMGSLRISRTTSIEDRQILAARRLGQSETILLTVKGATVPKEVKMGLWLTKTQHFRPRAVQCTICFTIGHRADVCSTAHEFTRAQRPARTAHECEVRCFNCEGPHGARDPRCPKKQQANKLTRLAAERRRLKTTTKDSAQTQIWQSARILNEKIDANPATTQAENLKFCVGPALPEATRAFRRTPTEATQALLWVAVLANYITPLHLQPHRLPLALAYRNQKPPGHFLAYKAETHADFNSRHAYWGYPDSSATGRILLDLAHTHHLSLLNDLGIPTRSGNSVQRDTNP